MTSRGSIAITRDAETRLVLFELVTQLGSMRIAISDEEARQVAKRIGELTNGTTAQAD